MTSRTDFVIDQVMRGNSAVVHNVKLLDVTEGEDGKEQLTIELDGQQYTLGGVMKWSESFSVSNTGQYGLLRSSWIDRQTVPVLRGAVFNAYLDQSLRRVPDLDYAPQGRSTLRNDPVAYWVCDRFPSGFYVPAGIIPGQDGQYIPDETVTVSLQVPPEFLEQCHRVQMTPEELLRSFVGDLAGIQNFNSFPRADGYGSNGSDERMYAEHWLLRAHGHLEIDLAKRAEQLEKENELEFYRDDLVALLEDYADNGGDPETLVELVSKVVGQLVTDGMISDTDIDDPGQSVH